MAWSWIPQAQELFVRLSLALTDSGARLMTQRRSDSSLSPAPATNDGGRIRKVPLGDSASRSSESRSSVRSSSRIMRLYPKIEARSSPSMRSSSPRVQKREQWA